jgi:hypothetical protein
MPYLIIIDAVPGLIRLRDLDAVAAGDATPDRRCRIRPLVDVIPGGDAITPGDPPSQYQPIWANSSGR